LIEARKFLILITKGKKQGKGFHRPGTAVYRRERAETGAIREVGRGKRSVEDA
jgi:hypothetical protein